MKNYNVIGQDQLISEVKRIFDIFKSSDCAIRPHFILTGASGTGKSFTIRNMTVSYDLNFIEINAAQLTKEGTSGNSLAKALSGLLQISNKPTIVFVDEFDKLFVVGNVNSDIADEHTTAVQNEFLKILESPYTSIFGDYGKYINVPVSNTLFIFSGAFNGEEDLTLDRLRELGMKTEFLGRVGLIYNTKPLALEDLFSILENSELLTNYLQLFEDSDREQVIYSIKAYLQKTYEFNTLGARLINTLIHQYFIKGGKLTKEEVKSISFQKKLKL